MKNIIMSRKIMSFRKQMTYLTTLNGIAWICTGIFDMFNNQLCHILNHISLLCSLFLIVKVTISEKENDDEMARQDLTKARSLTLRVLHRIFCFGMLFLAIFIKFPISDEISWKQVIAPTFFIAIGLEYLLTGIFFKILED